MAAPRRRRKEILDLRTHPVQLTPEVANFALTAEHIGDPMARQEVSRTVGGVFQDRPGEWRVSIIGSQANNRWEMGVEGPNMFERSYTLEGSAGEHRPEVILVLLEQMLPKQQL